MSDGVIQPFDEAYRQIKDWTTREVRGLDALPRAPPGSPAGDTAPPAPVPTPPGEMEVRPRSIEVEIGPTRCARAMGLPRGPE